MTLSEQDDASRWDLQHARRIIAVLVAGSSLAVFLAGIVLAAYAGIQWLQTAHWQPLTVNGALTIWPRTRDWAAHPRTWLGLHRVMMWVRSVPLFVIVTLLGGALVVLSAPKTRSATREDW